MLLLKVVGWVLVLMLCVCDGGFMVVDDKGFLNGRFAQWFDKVGYKK
jgi:hypothetical protein